MLDFHLSNVNKSKVILLRSLSATSMFSDYTVTLDGLSVTTCAAMKDLGVIIYILYHKMMQKN